MAKNEPYGTWRSPISASLTSSGSVRISDIKLHGGRIYWSEMRPEEKGRCVVVEYFDGEVLDCTPVGFNARTTVHEYGGGAYTAIDKYIYFSNFNDQLLYKYEHGSFPVKVTNNLNQRHADYFYDAINKHLICIREDHGTEALEAVNTIVSIDVDDGSSQTLCEGNDFYSNPRLSLDGRFLAFLTWNHPNMPWDGCELWVAEVERDNSLGQMTHVSGGAVESIIQPEWSSSGVLHFVSDKNGWWNLYKWEGAKVENVYPMEAEFGRPHWLFGLSDYCFETDNKIIAVYSKDGFKYLARIDTKLKTLESLETRYTDLSYLNVEEGCAVFLGGNYKTAPEVVKLDLQEGKTEVLRRTGYSKIDDGFISTPIPIDYPTENGLTAHALFYPPVNKDYDPLEGGLPPLIVKIHGGPTSAATTTLNWGSQYWTSRGFGLVDVNYGGSVGYGREYMCRLNGNWGIIDVEDSINAAKYLIQKKLVDPERITIRGGSAGGYTTLSALTFSNFFKAGASYFGLSDLEVFIRDTHKFESRYLFSLVGPYPESGDLYKERSAINHLDHLSAPLIIFQGLLDKVVPPNQAELMVEALRRNGLPVAYIAFEGEQHGFRMAENIKRSLEAELYFYSKIFGFTPYDNIEPVKIENLE